MTKLLTSLLRSPHTLPLRAIVRRLRETYYNTQVVSRLSSKTCPLRVRISESEPRRINIIVPEISFATFYGGYIAKLNLAGRLLSRGHRVRLIVVDLCDVRPEKLHQAVAAYEGLADVIDAVEIAYCHDRSTLLMMNPGDGLIATTWWTAYIANQLLKELEIDRFVYMIQEYEPFTFPMGSYYAAAHESYEFPHHAMFSSKLLMDYFCQNQFGVFHHGSGDGFSHAMYFENAILRFTRQPRPPGANKKVLFYARPEAHASRNMFETGFLALSKAISEGVFDSHWDFHGVGTNRANMPLPANRQLQMVGKLDLASYQKLLPQYDLGIALMFTPHPSLLPLEMAAAGMHVVTTTCLNKDDASLLAISDSIIAARPTVDGVLQAISEAVLRVNNSQPVAAVNWPTQWNETFSSPFLDTLESWLGNK